MRFFGWLLLGIGFVNVFEDPGFGITMMVIGGALLGFAAEQDEEKQQEWEGAPKRKCVRCGQRKDVSWFTDFGRICQSCRSKDERTCPKCGETKRRVLFERPGLRSGIGRICNVCAGSTGKLEVKAVQGRLSDDPNSPMVLNIRLRGSLAENQRGRDTSLWTSVVVKDGRSLKPVKTPVKQFMEADTDAYLHRIRMGQVSDWSQWMDVGIVIPEILIPPRGGRQTMQILSRIVDTSNPPPIVDGRVPGKSHPGVLWVGKVSRDHTFPDRGYLDESEALEAYEETRTLAVRLAVAIAFADDIGFEQNEGAAIRDWMESQVRSCPPHLKESLKSELNRAFKSAYKAGDIGTRARNTLVNRLSKIGGVTDRYRAIALCATVMAADGVADASEMTVIHDLARKLDLDHNKVSELIRERTTQLDLDADQSAAEEFYGIDPSWDRDETCKFIREQFTQTNGALSVLPPGVERENVKKQQESLAQLHMKYGCGGEA